MSKVFVNIALSLDGYMAPEGMTMENWDRPERWADKWGALMSWALDQQYLREKLKLGTGGKTGPVNDMIRHTFERTGVPNSKVERVTTLMGESPSGPPGTVKIVDFTLFG